MNTPPSICGKCGEISTLCLCEPPASSGTVEGVVGRVSDEDIIADAIEDGLIGIGLAMNAGFRHEIMANLEAAKTHLRAALDAVRELDAKRNGFPDTSPVAGNPVTANIAVRVK